MANRIFRVNSSMDLLRPTSRSAGTPGVAVPGAVADRQAPPRATSVADAVAAARDGLLGLRRDDSHWCFEFEADCTIPAEYVLMMHFLGEIDEPLQAKLAVYVRERQADHGGWPLYYGGKLDVSCSVKAYWALKLAGDPVDAPHMRQARAAILGHGGAAASNVFTRFALAMFGQVPWRAVPFVPVELMLLPRWFPFHLGKVSYWSRTVCVPLSILYCLRARAINPTGMGVRELFVTPPEEERNYFPVRSRMNRLMLWAERTVRVFEPCIPKAIRRRALRRAEQWFVDRLNGIDGLGGIFPAMVNALEAMVLLGYPEDHPLRRQARAAIDNLLVERDDDAYCQPCVSPVWDTALAMLALSEVQQVQPSAETARAIRAAGDWLVDRQVVDGPADWRDMCPDLEPGGWAFQYANPYYPDIDDTSAVLWALERADLARYSATIERGVRWTAGMQSSNGGFGAFDVDNDTQYLNEIPFADHGALLDPPTADVSARTLAILSILDRPEYREHHQRVLDYLLDEQEDFGGWFGRWGSNYVYGTWCALAALEFCSLQSNGTDPASRLDETRLARVETARQRAVAWLEGTQRADGSWGETNDSYEERALAGRGQEGTSFQTAWALLGLMACGRASSPAVRRGVEWLMRRQRQNGLWDEPWFSAPGFPRVFYLRYHGYSAYFPLWALARFQREHGELSDLA